MTLVEFAGGSGEGAAEEKAANLSEQIALKEAKSYSPAGKYLDKITLNDPRYPAWSGWIKKQYKNGKVISKIVVHYFYDTRTGKSTGYKIDRGN